MVMDGGGDGEGYAFSHYRHPLGIKVVHSRSVTPGEFRVSRVWPLG